MKTDKTELNRFRSYYAPKSLNTEMPDSIANKQLKRFSPVAMMASQLQGTCLHKLWDHNDNSKSAICDKAKRQKVKSSTEVTERHKAVQTVNTLHNGIIAKNPNQSELQTSESFNNYRNNDSHSSKHFPIG